jgi:hypothetical protein
MVRGSLQSPFSLERPSFPELLPIDGLPGGRLSAIFGSLSEYKSFTGGLAK